MTDLQLAKLLGEIDEELIMLPESEKRTASAGSAPRFLRYAAAVAAALFLAFIITTTAAEAAGIRVIQPFFSWIGSFLRIDYSGGLESHEDAPEITADPSERPKASSTPVERVIFKSEEELKARVGNTIRFPEDVEGLEFVSANCAFSGKLATIITEYTLDGKEIRVDSKKHFAELGTEYSTWSLWLNGVYKHEQKEIEGVSCTLAYGRPWNYISMDYDYVLYLIAGKTDMTVIERIAASIITD